LIPSLVQYLFKEALAGLGIGVHLYEILVHMEGVERIAPFLKVQFVKRDDKAKGFQQGSKAHDDAPGPYFNIAAVAVVVQFEQVMDFHTGLCDAQLGGSHAPQGDPLLDRKRFAHRPIDLSVNVLVVVG